MDWSVEKRVNREFLRTVTVTAILVVTTLLVMTGCRGGVDPEVSNQLKLVNDHLKKVAEAVNKSAELRDELDALFYVELTEQSCQQAEQLLASIQENVQTALNELREAEGVLVTVKQMDISKGMIKYAGMKLAALQEQGKSLELELNAMLLVRQALAARDSGAPEEDIIKYEQQIVQLQQQAKESASKAQNLHKEADDYYDERIGD